MFHQITILGPGLLGASLALAMTERALCQRIHAWSRRSETRERARRSAWCDAVFDDAAKACENSDLVVICTPVQTIVPLLREIAPILQHDALVTDVGSTKGQICREAQNCEVHFIGSHPMAGSERTGMDYAEGSLFAGAACILTPLAEHEDAQTKRLQELWERLGMRVTISTPEKHDEIVAHISHLPHLLASSLCSYLATKDTQWKDLAGNGLRDTTRIAAGDPVLWQQILEQNRVEAIRALDGVQNELDAMKTALREKNTVALTSRLKLGKEFRDAL